MSSMVLFLKLVRILPPTLCDIRIVNVPDSMEENFLHEAMGCYCRAFALNAFVLGTLYAFHCRFI